MRARCDGVIVNIRLWALKLLKWGSKRAWHCSVDIEVFQLSTIGCEVRSGDIVAMLFVDKSVGQVDLLRIIAERAF